MKKIIIMTMAAFAMASAAVAQTEAKNALEGKADAAVDKVAAKAKKIQDAADLKAFKEKQKADLAAFIEAQKNGVKAASSEEFKLEKPALVTEGDSMAYLFGVAQSTGLKDYISSQFGVDDEHLNRFAQGVIDRASADPNNKEQAAYMAGNQIGNQVMQMTKQFSDDFYAADKDMSIDVKIVAHAIVAGLLGKSDLPPVNASTEFQSKMKVRQEANKERLFGENRAAGEKFLEENKTKPGVVCTASGLQYKILTQGTGAKPTSSQKVTVDYEGRLIDGTVFDSSYKRGQAATFGVKQVIAGWTEALQLMPVGSKWELYIPYQLAYGDREQSKDIKPYSALIFTVELKGIE